MKVFGLLTILFAAVLSAQPQPAPQAPKISTEVLKSFYAADAADQRALRNAEAARVAVQSATDSLTKVVTTMRAVCGDKFILSQDSPDSDPYCAPKPEAPSPEKK